MNLVITGDGSHSIFVPELNEHYHSSYGALTESLHVFIKSGLEALPLNRPATIFEVGFGTGLNALLTCIAALEKKLTVQYYALENKPLQRDVYAGLNYPDMLHSALKPHELFMSIHESPWEKNCEIVPGFCLYKINQSLQEYIPNFSYDLIYFDAFAPEKQPEMWSDEIFRKLYDGANPGGILTTYCVKGEVKRMIKNAGFTIEKLPGPPGKREILRGRKSKL